MDVSFENREQLVEMLYPYLKTESERLKFTESALHGCDLLSQIVYHGEARKFANQLVTKALNFGECDPSQYAISKILTELHRYVDGKQQKIIDTMLITLQEPEDEDSIDLSEELKKMLVAAGLGGDSAEKLYVFISYARPDVEMAIKVEDFFMEAGIQVFRDQSTIRSGSAWDLMIEKALRKADYMILLLSKASMPERREVYREWFYFDQKKKPIIPLLLENCDLHSRMYMYNYVDIRKNPLSGFQRILSDLADESHFLIDDITFQERINEYDIKQVWVPPGKFLMGSNPSQDHYSQSHEQPAHSVKITSGFWLDMHPVTNEAYRYFIEQGGYASQALWHPDAWEYIENGELMPAELDAKFNAPQQPCVGVCWYEADAYARWRGGRLPTEAEWEYAARGQESLIFPWGNQYDSNRLNCNGSNNSTTIIGSYENGKSWVGALDLLGNVWEWVHDWYDINYYKNSPSENPQGPLEGSTHLLRGASWQNEQEWQRATARLHLSAMICKTNIGFRIVNDT